MCVSDKSTHMKVWGWGWRSARFSVVKMTGPYRVHWALIFTIGHYTISFDVEHHPNESYMRTEFWGLKPQVWEGHPRC